MIILGKSITATIPNYSYIANLGAKPRKSGSFVISTSGLNTIKPVLITNTPNSTSDDSLAWDIIKIEGIVVNSTTLKCFWHSNQSVSGLHKFTYRQV